MSRPNNYLIQAQQAKDRFLTYDQDDLIAKLKLRHDADYFYPAMLGKQYRLHRRTGDLQQQTPGGWADANTFGQVMTLLDLVCDSRPDRWVSGRWKNMLSFGLMFHQNLLENQRDPWAEKFEANPDLFRRACLALGGRPLPQGDIAYAIEVFDGLELVLQLWFGDEEFPANLRFLWDENALMYIKYETMHFARGLLLEQIAELMSVF